MVDQVVACRTGGRTACTCIYAVGSGSETVDSCIHFGKEI